MLWICIVAALIALSAGLALATDVQTRARLRSGRAGYDDLADHTGIWSRDRLAQLPGVRVDEAGELRVDPGLAAALPRTLGKRLLDCALGSVASLLAAGGACYVAARSTRLAWLLLALIGAYQVAGWVWAAAAAARAAR